MQETMVIQGRKVTPSDIDFIRELIGAHSNWHRTKLSQELCKLWDWRNPKGQLKDMACRTFLLKLARTGHIILPEPRREGTNHSRGKSVVTVDHSTEVIYCNLKSLAEIKIGLVASGSEHYRLFNHFLCNYHYLGYKTSVGENMKYMITDRFDRPLSCVLFGSAAWKTAPRDEFIGWSHRIREKKVNNITNNTRFLILPWVTVPYLASHILGNIAKRINGDWRRKYGHGVHLLETFVDRSRFKGTCYKAANWILTGQTKGRTRNDRYNNIRTTIKDVYVYPLSRDFRKELTQ